MSKSSSGRGPGRPPKSPHPVSASEPTSQATDAPEAKVPTPEHCCARCQFFAKDAKLNSGKCRRYPPIVGYGEFLYPLVAANAWCGEFRRDA